MSYVPEDPQHNSSQIHDQHIDPSSEQAGSPFDAVADGVMIYNGEGVLTHMNLAARKLLNVSFKQIDAKTSYFHILNQCLWYDENHRLLSTDQLPLSLLLHHQIAPCKPASRFVTAVHIGQEVQLLFCCSPLCDPQGQLSEVVCLLHELDASYQQAQSILRSYQTVSTLIEAFLHIPELIDLPIEEQDLRLLLRLQSVGHYLVDAIARTLEADQIVLSALGTANEVYYVAIYGLSAEQRLQRLQMNGRFSLADLLGEHIATRLSHRETIMTTFDRIPRPFAGSPEFGPYMILITPIFLRDRLIGLFAIHKVGVTRPYTSEEVLLATLTAQLIVLVLEYLQVSRTVDRLQEKALLQQEINYLVDAFLTSVNHEFRTPLTVILGNLQLAMHRLRALSDQISPQPGHFSPKLTAIQRPLEQASQGAHTLERLLTIIINAVQIHEGRFLLHQTHLDLGELITQIVMQQHIHTSDYTIELQFATDIPRIFADRSSIQQVITIYLLNALARTPSGQPVIVRVEQMEAGVRVAISDQGPAFRSDEQQAIWNRSAFVRAATSVHESDWSLGLGLYLCREIIQRHQGDVGLESIETGYTTFWFTLPIREMDKENDFPVHASP